MVVINPIRMLSVAMVLVSLTCCGGIEESRNYFKSVMDGSVGDSINIWGKGGFGPPGLIKKEPINKDIIKYIYRIEESGCEWFFVVRRNTDVVKSWGYLSDPDKCYLETDWFGPW